MVAIPELPADARFVRALLQSEELLQQQVPICEDSDIFSTKIMSFQKVDTSSTDDS